MALFAAALVLALIGAANWVLATRSPNVPPVVVTRSEARAEAPTEGRRPPAPRPAERPVAEHVRPPAPVPAPLLAPPPVTPAAAAQRPAEPLFEPVESLPPIQNDGGEPDDEALYEESVEQHLAPHHDGTEEP